MSEHTAENDAARLTDEQVDELVRLADAIAGDEPYALDALVGTVESWMAAHDAVIRAEVVTRLIEAPTVPIAEPDNHHNALGCAYCRTHLHAAALRAAQPTEGES